MDTLFNSKSSSCRDNFNIPIFRKKSKKKTEEDKRDLGFELTADPPTRNKKNQLVFDGAPDFRYNIYIYRCV